MEEDLDFHVGRSWSGTPLEDECPCPKAPCGLVKRSEISTECVQHSWQAAKTFRQIHMESNCPALTKDKV